MAKRKREYSLLVNGQVILTGTYAVVMAAYEAFERWKDISPEDFDICISFRLFD